MASRDPTVTVLTLIGRVPVTRAAYPERVRDGTSRGAAWMSQLEHSMDIFLLAFVIFSLLFSITIAAAIVLVDRRMERRDTHITLRRHGGALEGNPGVNSKEIASVVAGHSDGITAGGEYAPRGRAVHPVNLVAAQG